MAAIAANGVIRQGWLLKKKEGWKAMAMFQAEKRFVRLTSEKVSYYTSDDDDVAKGVFDLGPSLKVAANKEENVSFSISDESRTITLQASTEDERNLWMRTILEAVARLQGGGVHQRGLSDALESINARFSNPVQRQSTTNLLKPGTHEGLLQKEGSWRWQERYFKLEDGVLSYWTSKADRDKPCTKAFQITAECRVEDVKKKRKLCFCLRTTTKQLYLVPRDVEDRGKWMENLQRTVGADQWCSLWSS